MNLQVILALILSVAVFASSQDPTAPATVKPEAPVEPAKEDPCDPTEVTVVECMGQTNFEKCTDCIDDLYGDLDENNFDMAEFINITMWDTVIDCCQTNTRVCTTCVDEPEDYMMCNMEMIEEEEDGSATMNSTQANINIA